MVPPTHHFSDMCPFFFTPQSYKISHNLASVAMRSSDRTNRDNRPNKPNRQALPEQRHHRLSPPIGPIRPIPARCRSSATPHRLSPPIRPIGPITALRSSAQHRLSPPIGPIRPIGPIPARCPSSAQHRLSQPIDPIGPIGPIPTRCLCSANAEADISPTPAGVEAVRNPVFRRPGRRRHAGTTPEVVAIRHRTTHH